MPRLPDYKTLDSALAALLAHVTLMPLDVYLVDTTLGRFVPRVNGGGFYWSATFTQQYGNTAHLDPETPNAGNPDTLPRRIDMCLAKFREVEERLREDGRL